AICRGNVEMVTRLTFRDAERLASFDAKVPLMDVTDCGEAVDGGLHIPRLDHDHEVDHRLGGETGDCRRTNVFDRDSDVADGTGRTVTEPLELERPSRAVVDDDDRIRHGLKLGASLVTRQPATGRFEQGATGHAGACPHHGRASHVQGSAVPDEMGVTSV